MANPFEDDLDDFSSKNAAYAKKKAGNVARTNLGLDPVPSFTYTNNRTIEDEVEDYEREIEKYMQQSLDSTQRSRQQLVSSEQLAQATAKDLLEQREKLERADRNLDEIHHTTQLTQRSLNSLKSMLGGYFKNKLSKAPKAPVNDMPVSKSENQLSRVLDQQQRNSVATGIGGGSGARTLGENSRSQISGTRWEAMDNQIDENLDEMSKQLSNLKTWGNALGAEVVDQNRLLDRIQVKAEGTSATVHHQDDQMRKLLGYKVPSKTEKK